MMMLNSKPVPVVGRVSMDMTTLDLGPLPQANVGDEVTVLDSDPLSACSVYALARWADTLPYEIFCRIGSRIHRVPAEIEETQAKQRRN
jgi:alanine racemase